MEASFASRGSESLVCVVVGERHGNHKTVIMEDLRLVSGSVPPGSSDASKFSAIGAPRVGDLQPEGAYSHRMTYFSTFTSAATLLADWWFVI